MRSASLLFSALVIFFVGCEFNGSRDPGAVTVFNTGPATWVVTVVELELAHHIDVMQGWKLGAMPEGAFVLPNDSNVIINYDNVMGYLPGYDMRFLSIQL